MQSIGIRHTAGAPQSRNTEQNYVRFFGLSVTVEAMESTCLDITPKLKSVCFKLVSSLPAFCVRLWIVASKFDQAMSKWNSREFEKGFVLLFMHQTSLFKTSHHRLFPGSANVSCLGVSISVLPASLFIVTACRFVPPESSFRHPPWPLRRCATDAEAGTIPSKFKTLNGVRPQIAQVMNELDVHFIIVVQQQEVPCFDVLVISHHSANVKGLECTFQCCWHFRPHSALIFHHGRTILLDSSECAAVTVLFPFCD